MALADLPRRIHFGCLCSVTRLSYTATHRACAPWCRSRQISPCDPVTLLPPQQPTCREPVRPSRACRAGDFHPFPCSRVSRVATTPVSMSPNFTCLPGARRGLATSRDVRRDRRGENPSVPRMPRQLNYEHAASGSAGSSRCRGNRPLSCG